MGDSYDEDIKRRHFARVLSSVVGFLGALVAGFSAFYVVGSFGEFPSLTSDRFAEIKVQLETNREKLDRQIIELRRKLGSLDSQWSAVSTVPPEAAVNIKLTRIEEKANNLGQRLQKLEGAILEDPEKAISIPILRKELEGLRGSFTSEVSSLRAEVERIYDLNKWFVGLMFTMALGIIGLAVSNFLKPTKGDLT